MVLFDVESIAKAIQETSVPLWVTIILAVLPVLTTVIIFWRQNKIIKEQLKVASRQNDIALYEKRYEVYQHILQFSSNVHVLVYFLSDKNKFSDYELLDKLFENFNCNIGCSFTEKNDYIMNIVYKVKSFYELELESESYLKSLEDSLRSLQYNIIPIDFKNSRLSEEYILKCQSEYKSLYLNHQLSSEIDNSIENKIYEISKILNKFDIVNELKEKTKII